jgi:hypothetical protein
MGARLTLDPIQGTRDVRNLHIWIFAELYSASLKLCSASNMLVLYETSLGFCLFKLTDSAKLESADLWEDFQSPEKANKLCVNYVVYAML